METRTGWLVKDTWLLFPRECGGDLELRAGDYVIVTVEYAAQQPPEADGAKGAAKAEVITDTRPAA